MGASAWLVLGYWVPLVLGDASGPAQPPNYLSAPRNRPEGKVLETVGVFEAPKQHGKYETGQVSDFGEHSFRLVPWRWSSQVTDP